MVLTATAEIVESQSGDVPGSDVQGSLATEPGASGQWYLRNTGQTGGVLGIDLDIVRAWLDYTGRGVKIGIVDDGFDLAQADLAANFKGGWDLAGNDASPAAEGTDRHGTTTAGVIGADDNGTGLLGVAHDADLYGFRVSFGATPLSMLADAMARQAAMDVSSNSWGFTTAFGDDFASSSFSGFASAIATAASTGRHGLGTVIVVAGGNGRTSGDDVNNHNFSNSQYVIAVAALDASGHVASFSNPGAALLVSAPGVGILTTDRTGTPGYSTGDTVTADGTSYSTPMVAGVAALMLQANPGLGYRDVQQILAASARQVDAANAGWTTNHATTWNGGGQDFSNDYGFGLVDATAAVRLAESWFATGTVAATAANRAIAEASWQGSIAIPDNNAAGIVSTLALADAVRIDRIELDLSITHSYVGDLVVSLVSPDGTASTLVSRPGNGSNGSDDLHFTVASNAFRAEDAAGTWSLHVYDLAGIDVGTLTGWTLRAIGDAPSADDSYIYTDAFATDFSTLADAARHVLADAAGSDTINAAAVSTACTIDLLGLSCTIAGSALAIAAGTVIENAIGGDGADRITGNGLANILWGGRGDDLLAGGGGDDILKGGAGNDLMDGGAGTDSALYDIVRAAATIGWDGSVLLVGDGSSIDRLSGIETLVFADQSISVASLVPPDAPASLKFTNSTPAASAAGQAFFAAAPAPGGSASYGTQQLGIAGVAAGTQVVLASAADGALSITLASAWNTLKVAAVTDSDGGAVSIANFVEVSVAFGGTRDSIVSATDAKRGSIATGAGNDSINVAAYANNKDGGNSILVDSGSGADTITLSAQQNWTVFDVRAGAGDDAIRITGPSADRVDGGLGNDRIDAGAGNDTLTGGGGADIFVGRAGSGRDIVTDFADGIDRIELAGIAPAAVTIAAVAGGVRVAWGSDSITLNGASLAQITAADIVFA